MTWKAHQLTYIHFQLLGWFILIFIFILNHSFYYNNAMFPCCAASLCREVHSNYIIARNWLCEFYLSDFLITMRLPDSCWCRLKWHVFCVDFYSVLLCICMYTNPLQRVNSGVVLSSLQMLGKETVGDRGEFLIARVPLTFIPGISHLRDAQPFLLWHLCQLSLCRDGKEDKEGWKGDVDFQVSALLLQFLWS